MNTLAEAWNWYQSAKTNLQRIRRLATKHWDSLSNENASLWRDEQFKSLTDMQIKQETTTAIGPLDDLAIVVLFSVFEALVREHLETVVHPEADRLSHPIMRQAAEDAINGIREGSFFNRVLSPLKLAIPAEVIEQVNQVRDYRNWVAHGKRKSPKKGTVNLSPKEAYDRLSDFLERLGIAPRSEVEEA